MDQEGLTDQQIGWFASLAHFVKLTCQTCLSSTLRLTRLSNSLREPCRPGAPNGKPETVGRYPGEEARFIPGFRSGVFCLAKRPGPQSGPPRPMDEIEDWEYKRGGRGRNRRLGVQIRALDGRFRRLGDKNGRFRRLGDRKRLPIVQNVHEAHQMTPNRSKRPRPLWT